MYKISIFNVCCLVLSLRLSVENKVKADRCFQYKECWMCVEDPCSRRKEAEDVNNICVWCDNYGNLGSACISTREDRMCLPEPMKYVDQCKTEQRMNVPTDPKVTPFITENYVVHLEDLRNDIFGTIQAEVGVQNFHVWIAIGRVVNTKSVVDKCGSYTPISAIEVDDRLPSSPPIGRRDRCWNLGNITSVSPILLDTSNPQQGIELDFGTSPCCCGSRNTTYINTTVLLKEGYCSYDFVNSSVTAGNIAKLTNCSESNSSLQFLVQTSVLCQNHLEWRLSVKMTTAFCTKKMPKEYRCTIELKAAAKEAVIASSFPYCQNNFLLWKTFHNGSEENASSYQLPSRKGIRDSCSFVIDSHDLCTLSIVYLYGNNTPQLIPINGSTSFQLSVCDHSDEPFYKNWWFGPALGVGVLFTLALVVVFGIYKCRQAKKTKYQRLKNNDHPEQSKVAVDRKHQTESATHTEYFYTPRPRNLPHLQMTKMLEILLQMRI
ncbi:uncharacterized protein LOC134189140 isoform X2 [Corticium candelabrum]|uniref:uncharacterized protein LOC134189140 isoform X2 n=1 Tax=Corticium candelabrum TaxID=121492 RepID=UPI002E26942F|nr:uncharacterized protein LOC134189140 isoform X2 [Corticium candelabrum]